jgi:enoyl-CoA hydratase/carnithine racemase
MSTPDYQQIIYSVDARVATITLNRPDQLNAFTGTMMREMIDAFDRIDADDDVRAVIVTGAGRGFCAGADLSSGGETFSGGGSDQGTGAEIEGQPVTRDGGGLLTLRIFECTKPVIAAVNGAAVGVGVTMTLPMDIRLASEGARFGFVFARRGIVPEAASSWFLPRIVGISQARSGATRADHVGAGGEGRPAGAQRALGRRAASRGEGDREGDRGQHRTRQRGVDAPDAVADARGDHPMQAHRVDSRAIASRGRSAMPRGRDELPREASRRVPGQGQRRTARCLS